MKNIPLMLMLIVLASLFMSASVKAADYHVAVNGTDAASGAAAQPFRTIQHAIDAAGQPGDTVTIHPGIYREELKVLAQGTPERPITLKATEEGKAILDGARRVQGWRPLEGAETVWCVDFGDAAPYNND